MRHNSFIILLFACAGCFSDTPMHFETSGTTGTDGTDSGGSGGGTAGTSGDSASATSQDETSGVSGTSGSTGAVSGSSGGSGSVSDSDGSTSGSSGSETGSPGTSSSTSGSTGGGIPAWSECLDNTDGQTAKSCDTICQNMGQQCVEECGPNANAGIQAAMNVGPALLCEAPFTPHTLCTQLVISYIQCCCV